MSRLIESDRIISLTFPGRKVGRPHMHATDGQAQAQTAFRAAEKKYQLHQEQATSRYISYMT